MGFLGLIKRAGGTANNSFLPISNLCQDGTQACHGRVSIQAKRQTEVGEGSDGAGGKVKFEGVEGLLALWGPMKHCVLPSEGVEKASNGSEVLHIAPVISCEAQEGANFGGTLGRLDVPNGFQEVWVGEKAVRSDPVSLITDFCCSEGAFFSSQFQFSLPQTVEDLTEVSHMFLPGLGEDDDVVQIEEAGLPMQSGEDAIHEAGEGGGGALQSPKGTWLNSKSCPLLVRKAVFSLSCS